MKDENWRVRKYSARALGKIGDTRALEPLIAVLKNDKLNVRIDAAEALGNIGDTRAVESLIAALKDEHPWIYENAAEALEKITGQDFWEDGAKWQEWWNENKNKILKSK